MKDFFLLLFSYLKRHLAVIITVVTAITIFTAVFSLYSLPVESIIYASALCIFSFCIVGMIRFKAFCARHRMLEDVKKSISAVITDFPEPLSRIESDYQEIIRLLDISRAEVISDKDRILTDMTDYYTMWAHQIKTPIAAMRLLLQSEHKELNSEISEQLFKIEQYVEMVLGYLRTESMTGDLVINNCSLDRIVKQAIKKYAKSFIRKKILLDYSELNMYVLTDEKWLCFVIEQVLSNALKYTNEGKISIYTEYTESLSPLTLVIEDTGIGIQPDDLPRIGQKGFTGYNGREYKKSTGIGLYLCGKILKNLSHTMTVESEVGIGTRVKIMMLENNNRHE